MPRLSQEPETEKVAEPLVQGESPLSPALSFSSSQHIKLGNGGPHGNIEITAPHNYNISINITNQSNGGRAEGATSSLEGIEGDENATFTIRHSNRLSNEHHAPGQGTASPLELSLDRRLSGSVSSKTNRIRGASDNNMLVRSSSTPKPVAPSSTGKPVAFRPSTPLASHQEERERSGSRTPPPGYDDPSGLSGRLGRPRMLRPATVEGASPAAAGALVPFPAERDWDSDSSVSYDSEDAGQQHAIISDRRRAKLLEGIKTGNLELVQRQLSKLHMEEKQGGQWDHSFTTEVEAAVRSSEQALGVDRQESFFNEGAGEGEGDEEYAELTRRINIAMNKRENRSVFHRQTTIAEDEEGNVMNTSTMKKVKKKKKNYYDDKAGDSQQFSFGDMVFFLAPKLRIIENRMKVVEEVDEPPDLSPAPRSLFLFTLDNRFRQWCMRIVKHKYFDNFVLFCIGLNFVFLIFDDDPPIGSLKYIAFETADKVFVIIFFFELCFKVVAMSFVVHKNSYLRNPWNVLDFVVVCLSFLTFFDGMQTVSAIRAARVVRPLRAIKSIPGMRIIITSLLSSLPYLLDVSMLYLMIILIFGILGVQLFGGNLSQKCFSAETGMKVPGQQEWIMCSIATGAGVQCNDLYPEMGADVYCASGENPNFGLTNFDNILFATMAILQVISLEGWADIMYGIQSSSHELAAIYFIVIVFAGSYFVLNLVIAIIFLRFDQQKRAYDAEKLEKLLMQAAQNPDEFSITGDAGPAYDEDHRGSGGSPNLRRGSEAALNAKIRRGSDAARDGIMEEVAAALKDTEGSPQGILAGPKRMSHSGTPPKGGRTLGMPASDKPDKGSITSRNIKRGYVENVDEEGLASVLVPTGLLGGRTRMTVRLSPEELADYQAAKKINSSKAYFLSVNVNAVRDTPQGKRGSTSMSGSPSMSRQASFDAGLEKREEPPVKTYRDSMGRFAAIGDPGTQLTTDNGGRVIKKSLKMMKNVAMRNTVVRTFTTMPLSVTKDANEDDEGDTSPVITRLNTTIIPATPRPDSRPIEQSSLFDQPSLFEQASSPMPPMPPTPAPPAPPDPPAPPTPSLNAEVEGGVNDRESGSAIMLNTPEKGPLDKAEAERHSHHHHHHYHHHHHRQDSETSNFDQREQRIQIQNRRSSPKINTTAIPRFDMQEGEKGKQDLTAAIMKAMKAPGADRERIIHELMNMEHGRKPSSSEVRAYRSPNSHQNAVGSLGSNNRNHLSNNAIRQSIAGGASQLGSQLGSPMRQSIAGGASQFGTPLMKHGSPVPRQGSLLVPRLGSFSVGGRPKNSTERIQQAHASLVALGADPGSRSRGSIIVKRRSSQSVQSTSNSVRVHGHSVALLELTALQKYVFIPAGKLIGLRAFSDLVVVAILLNTITMTLTALDDKIDSVLDVFNVLFYSIFLVEMVAKILGMGIRQYVKDKMNVFDGAVVLVGTVELIWSGNNVLSVLRTFRLLRVLKLLNTSPSLRTLMKAVLLSIEDILYFLAVLTLLIITFAILGVQFFRGNLEADGMTPRINFETLENSIVTVFQVVTAENWNEVMYKCYRTVGWPSTFFFVPLLYLGHYMFLSLFLAIMLGNFDQLDIIQIEEYDSGESKWEKEEPRWISKQFTKVSAAWSRLVERLRPEQEVDEDVDEDDDSDDSDAEVPLGTASTTTGPLSKIGTISKIGTKSLSRGGSKSGTLHRQGTFRGKPVFAAKRPMRYSRHSVSMVVTESWRIHGQSFCMGPKHPFRRRLAEIVHSSNFDTGVVSLISVSMVLLALEGEFPTTIDTGLLAAFHYADIVVTIFFTIEMSLKAVALGILVPKGAYLRSPWNILDFVIVVISIANLALDATGISFDIPVFKLMRILRCFRALRMLTHVDRLRMVVQSIAATLVQLKGVLLVYVIFFTIFAIMAVQFFNGRMWHCENAMTGKVVYNTTLDGVHGDVPCLGPENVWANYAQNYDNFYQALLVLYQISTLEMWPEIMAKVQDSSPDMGAIYMNFKQAYIYFIIAIMICAYFVGGLVVGVIVDQYNKQNEKFTGALDLTEAQRYYLQAYKDLVYNPPPTNPRPIKAPMASGALGRCEMRFRHGLFKLVMNKWFEVFIMFCIGLNILVMCLSSYYDSAETKYIYDMITLVFSGIFLTEMVLKLLVLGISQYFEDSWNSFDCFIVTISVLTFVLQLIGGTYIAPRSRADVTALTEGATSEGVVIDPSIFRVFRIFRVLRIIRLMKRFKGMQQIVQTLFISIPALNNVVLLLAILHFLFAVIGMHLFGDIGEGREINSLANFSTFHNAFFTLFRISTGESWNQLMYDCMDPINCFGSELSCSIATNKAVIIPFFYLFHFSTYFLMINVFIAVVLKNFEEEVMNDPKNSTNPISRDVIQIFGLAWAEMCEGDSMRCEELENFLTFTAPPLGPPLSDLRPGPLLRLLNLLEIPQYEGTVHWLDLALALTALNLFPGVTPLMAHVGKKNEMYRGTKMSAITKFPRLKKTRKYQFSAADYCAAIAIQKRWRRRAEAIDEEFRQGVRVRTQAEMDRQTTLRLEKEARSVPKSRLNKVGMFLKKTLTREHPAPIVSAPGGPGFASAPFTFASAPSTVAHSLGPLFSTGASEGSTVPPIPAINGTTVAGFRTPEAASGELVEGPTNRASRPALDEIMTSRFIQPDFGEEERPPTGTLRVMSGSRSAFA